MVISLLQLKTHKFFPVGHTLKIKSVIIMVGINEEIEFVTPEEQGICETFLFSYSNMYICSRLQSKSIEWFVSFSI